MERDRRVIRQLRIVQGGVRPCDYRIGPRRAFGEAVRLRRGDVGVEHANIKAVVPCRCPGSTRRAAFDQLAHDSSDALRMRHPAGKKVEGEHAEPLREAGRWHQTVWSGFWGGWTAFAHLGLRPASIGRPEDGVAQPTSAELFKSRTQGDAESEISCSRAVWRARGWRRRGSSSSALAKNRARAPTSMRRAP